MEFALSWDIVLMAVMIVLMAYNFILGQNATIKLILSIYIAILTADGIIVAIRQFLFDPSPGWQELMGSSADYIFTSVRLLVFLLAIVLFVIRGKFHVAVDSHDHWAGRMAVHALFAMFSAVLFLATVLIYLSGNSFVEGMMFAPDISIYADSLVARIMIDYYQLWFSLPAVVFLGASMVFEE